MKKAFFVRLTETERSELEALVAVSCPTVPVYRPCQPRASFLDRLIKRYVPEFVAFPSDAGRFLLDERYEDGRFYHDAGRTRFDRKSMAYGMAGIHGHVYAWVRWSKPGGADDMGSVREGHLARFLGYDAARLTDVTREIAGVLNQAWEPDKVAWDFGEGTTTYRLSELGALLRGTKGVYEMLYVFGDETDREQAEQIFRQTAAKLSALLAADAVRRDWGLPSQVAFTENGVEPRSEVVDTAELWSLVNHLAVGFALAREREGTARFFERLEPNLLDDLGRFTDQMLTGALEHQMQDGYLVETLDFETGEIRRDDRSVASIGRFITAAGNAYRLGTAFERADEWDEVAEDVRKQSRNLYDALLAHAVFLETGVLDPEQPVAVDRLTRVGARLVEWLGRFHPPTAHFPVALLIAGALAELIGLISRRPWFFDAGRFCVWGGTIGAVVASPLGWFNAGWDLPGDDWVLGTHRWLGTLVFFWAIGTLALGELVHRGGAHRWRPWYRTVLFLGAILVAVTAHFGGILVFGTDYYHWPG